MTLLIEVKKLEDFNKIVLAIIRVIPVHVPDKVILSQLSIKKNGAICCTVILIYLNIEYLIDPNKLDIINRQSTYIQNCPYEYSISFEFLD